MLQGKILGDAQVSHHAFMPVFRDSTHPGRCDLVRFGAGQILAPDGDLPLGGLQRACQNVRQFRLTIA